MTHTLHRQGNPEDLADDFVVFAIAAQGVNARGSSNAFSRFAEIVMKHNPVNFGDMRTGNVFSVGEESVLQGFQDNSIVHAVFTDPETVATVLKELSMADLGPSIVVSGLVDPTTQCCKKAGIEPHTVEHSLGVWGAVDRLPSPEVQELSTMCGHGMIAFGLIEHLARRVKKGLEVEKASQELARQCHCGVFNPVRGARILKAYASKLDDERSDGGSS